MWAGAALVYDPSGGAGPSATSPDLGVLDHDSPSTPWYPNTPKFTPLLRCFEGPVAPPVDPAHRQSLEGGTDNFDDTRPKIQSN